jgi:DNA-binding IclR family transcriptional regulator
MLGQVIRGELQDLATTIHAGGNDTYLASIGLCMLVAGYIAIDVSQRWPTAADIEEIARHTAETTTGLGLGQQDVYSYLSRAVLGSEPVDDVFPDAGKALTAPVLATGRLLLAFCPRDTDWWEYLDTIWNANDAADRADLSMLPALMFKWRRNFPQGHRPSNPG